MKINTEKAKADTSRILSHLPTERKPSKTIRRLNIMNEIKMHINREYIKNPNSCFLISIKKCLLEFERLEGVA